MWCNVVKVLDTEYVIHTGALKSRDLTRLCCDSVAANYGTVALWWVDACRESAAYSAAE